MAFDKVLNLCLEKWRDARIALAPPIPEKEIRRTWERLRKNLSDDVLRLYTTLGGFEEYRLDEPFFWCLWRWDYLQATNSRHPSEGVSFCDHSIDLIRWELRFEDARTSSVWTLGFGAYDGQPARKTTDDLETFFQKYLDDPWDLLTASSG
jgi:hypothetical protein